MNVAPGRAARRFAEFAIHGVIPAEARHAAQIACVDTVGVILAGCVEPPARIVQRVCAAEGGHPRCRVLGTPLVTGAAAAALANGTAAHALDYDDMCFVSLAHPSAPLVAAALAAGELRGSSGRELLDAYVAGFELECVLGRAVNPTHYARGWHCTSTLGSVGAAAAACRLLRLDPARTARAVSIAASEASGLKDNFGTMVKPLHAGLAARNGVLAALLAAEGFTAADTAIDGAQGFVAAMSDAGPDAGAAFDDLGTRWEIVETGVTVKLYPSCAATHPPVDALLDLRAEHGFGRDDIVSIDIAVDTVTPSVLIYPDPQTGLEAKFSLQFCAAAAAAFGRVGIDTFEDSIVRDEGIRRLAARVSMTPDPEIGRGAPSLTRAHVTVTLTSGRVLTARVNGARGYPERPASREELDAKFRACAARALDREAIEAALRDLRRLEDLPDVRTIAVTRAAVPSSRESTPTPAPPAGRRSR